MRAEMKFFITFLLINSIAGYENAYDLLERRNQKRFYEPRRRFYQSAETFADFDDGDRYFSRDRNPFPVFATPGPYFGNGYDNLGNGIPARRFPTFPQDRRYDRRLERHLFQGFRDGFEHDPYPRGRSHPDRHRLGYEPHPARRIDGGEFDSRVDRLLQDDEDKKQKKTDEVFRRSHEGVRADSLKKEKTGEHLRTDQTGENKSSVRSNRVVKKGRTTKGFASHHHKDETGNSTTYFDESSDFGGQSDFKDVADGFDTKKTLDQITDLGDEKHYNENGGQTGIYGTDFSSGNQKSEKELLAKARREQGLAFDDDHDRDVGFTKTFRYLNGDKFDFADHYY